ncbi:MAG: DUF58 domain-containing protein [Candidatus Eisenbacteria bacterium]|nr:DUF58 domain-containing protein [Candidatus Eisenbacteria bacterium]
MDQRALLDPYFVSKLRRLDLIARLVVEGFITGLHKSPYHGFSVEFAEHRPYMPGDEIRAVDWKVYGRTDRYFIKEFEEETNLRGYLLLDTSSSMAYRSSERLLSKLRYAVHLAAALSYLMIQQQDAVGLLLFDEQIRRFVPARSVPAHLRVLLGELARAAADPGGDSAETRRRTEIGRSLHYLADRITRRGLVVLISDLMDRPENVMAGLKHFRHRQHEVVVLHLLDPAEVAFPFQDELVFVDMETGDRLSAVSWELAPEYRRRVERWQRSLQRMCGEHAIDYLPVRSDTPYDVSLLRYLEKRRRLH